MIYENLEYGKEHAKTGRELAAHFGVNIRFITDQIERERRDGYLICASTDYPYGYFLAKTVDEAESYCNQLKNRAIQIFITRRELLKSLEAKKAEGYFNDDS